MKNLIGIPLKDFAKDLGSSISRNQTFDLGAELAFWSVLAVFPFAIFLLTVIGFIPLHGIDAQLTTYLYQVMPKDAAALIDQTVHEIIGKQRGGLLIISFLGALWSASGGISSTITALNRAYDVHETRPFWKVKLVSLACTAAGAVAIVIAVSSLMIGPEFVRKVTDIFGLGKAFDVVWRWARFPVIVASLATMLAALYYFLPNVKQKFRIISPGSVIAIALWILASLGFSFYVSHFAAYAKTYGTLGTGVVLMMWIYISSVIMIVGGEINALLDVHVLQIEHTEREPGPVTKPDRGVAAGEVPHDEKTPEKSSELQKSA